jgi:hypothetical protein
MSLENKTIDGIDVSGWTAEQIAELTTFVNESAIADQEANAIIAEENSPANVIAKKRKLAEFKKRELADVRATKAAQDKFGENEVGVIETRQGSIVMRTATCDEDDELNSRAKAARERGASDEEYEFVKWEVVAKTICHPSREKVDEIVKKYPRAKELVIKLYVGLVEGATGRALGK